MLVSPQFNRSAYFYNASWIIGEMYLKAWRSFFKKLFFLPFLQKLKSFITLIRTLSEMLVMNSVLCFHNPVTSADKNIIVSYVQARSWFDMWRGRGSFTPPTAFWRSGKKGVMDKIWEDINEVKLKGLVNDLKSPDLCLILRANNTSS